LRSPRERRPQSLVIEEERLAKADRDSESEVGGAQAPSAIRRKAKRRG